MENYKNKYLKYKNKYLTLKTQIGASGGGPFHTLVIGGGDSIRYGDGFFEVGNHPVANFGENKNWNDENFWLELFDFLNIYNLKFKSIIIDNGSASWLNSIPENVIEFIAFLFSEVIDKEGIILIHARKYTDNRVDHTKHREPFTEVLYNTLKGLNFKDINMIRFGNSIDDDVNLILSLQNGAILRDRTNVYAPTINIGRWNSNGYIENIDPTFKSVNEKDQIEFIKNRIGN